MVGVHAYLGLNIYVTAMNKTDIFCSENESSNYSYFFLQCFDVVAIAQHEVGTLTLIVHNTSIEVTDFILFYFFFRSF